MAGSVPRQKRHWLPDLCSCCLVSTGLRQSLRTANPIIEVPPFGSDNALGETCWLLDRNYLVRRHRLWLPFGWNGHGPIALSPE